MSLAYSVLAYNVSIASFIWFNVTAKPCASNEIMACDYGYPLPMFSTHSIVPNTLGTSL